ncbi:MAG: glycosyltransferase family 9 protein [bacterium]
MSESAETLSLPERGRIALVRLSALGDVINTLPALTALRWARPEAHLTWIVEPASAGVLRDHPLLDDVVVADRKRWSKALRQARSLRAVAGEMGEFSRRLRDAGFAAAIDFQGNLRSGVVTYLTRAPLRVGLGRRDGKEMTHLFTNRHVPLPPEPLHRVERSLHVLECLGIDTADAEPVLPVRDADRERVDALLAECGLACGAFATIHAGVSAFGRYKQWPNDRWAAVVSRLRDELGLCVVLTRGPADAEAEGAEAIARRAAADALVAPLLSLGELAELCRRCRVFLSVDTGPMHLASAAGAPVIALFGPKDPRLYGPYFGSSAIVEKDLECRPCRKRSCDDPRCMLAIQPGDVMDAVRRLMRDA